MGSYWCSMRAFLSCWMSADIVTIAVCINEQIKWWWWWWRRRWWWWYPCAQTDTQTDILITILRNRSHGEVTISVWTAKKYYVTIPHPVVPDILSHKNINRTRDRHLTLFPWKTSVPITLKDSLESNLIKAHIVWCMPWWASLLQRMTLRDRSA